MLNVQFEVGVMRALRPHRVHDAIWIASDLFHSVATAKPFHSAYMSDGLTSPATMRLPAGRG
jgi:hypothetical protein